LPVGGRHHGPLLQAAKTLAPPLCGLGDRKVIWPVNNLAPAVCVDSYLGGLGERDLVWSDLHPENRGQ